MVRRRFFVFANRPRVLSVVFLAEGRSAGSGVTSFPAVSAPSPREPTAEDRLADGQPSTDSTLESLERDRLLELLRRFGRNPGSFLVLYDAPWRYFVDPLAEGAVCYIEVNRTAVVWCDPLCAQDRVGGLLARFTRAMRARGLRVCLVAVEEDTARLALGAGYAVLKIGEEPVFDLGAWRRPRGDPGKKLRWCLNHARRAGVTVTEYRAADGRDPALEEELMVARRDWEASLGRRPVRSFLRAAPLAEIRHKRVFLARRAGRLEAVLACSPVFGRNGWYLEDLIRVPGAVNGATELVVVEAMERLGAAGASFASLGIAPLRGSGEQMDRRAGWMARALHVGFERFDRQFHFASLSRFKAKFRPTAWEPRYVAFNPPRPSVGLARAVISVLDPTPAPEARPRTVSSSGSRVLVGAQALLLGLASLLVLAGNPVGDRVGSVATLLAPVGLAGMVIAVLLWVLAARMARGEGLLVRALAVALEAGIALATLGRLHHGRGVALDVVSLLVAGTVLVLAFRPAEHADVPDDAS